MVRARRPRWPAAGAAAATPWRRRAAGTPRSSDEALAAARCVEIERWLPRLPRMRVLALDHGEARCGCAVSDPSGTLATPLEAVERPDTPQGTRTHRRAGGGARGRAGGGGPAAHARRARRAQAASAREFAERLEARLDVPVEIYDERLTTRMAEATGGRADADSRAAAHLLESYLAACRRSRSDARPHARGARARRGSSARQAGREAGPPAPAARRQKPPPPPPQRPSQAASARPSRLRRAAAQEAPPPTRPGAAAATRRGRRPASSQGARDPAPPPGGSKGRRRRRRRPGEAGAGCCRWRLLGVLIAAVGLVPAVAVPALQGRRRGVRAGHDPARVGRGRDRRRSSRSGAWSPARSSSRPVRRIAGRRGDLKAGNFQLRRGHEQHRRAGRARGGRRR